MIVGTLSWLMNMAALFGLLTMIGLPIALELDRSAFGDIESEISAAVRDLNALGPDMDKLEQELRALRD